MTTSRTDFNETWLMEMPKRISSTEMFSSMADEIRELIDSGITPIALGSNFYKIELTDSVYYWYQDDTVIVLATELSKRQQGLVVNGVAKNPDKKYRGQPPSAPQLYDAILNDSNRSIRLLSDTLMTDLGLDIWKRLFNMGHKISVYDEENPGKSFTTLHSLADFDQYFGNDRDKARYQFVLSERSYLAECRSYFNSYQ